MLTFPVRAFGGYASFKPTPRNDIGSTALDGSTQVGDGGAPIWQGRIAGLRINNRRRVLLWRQLSYKIQGRRTSFLVEVCEGTRQPRHPNYKPSAKGTPHSDGTYFDDDTGYREEQSAGVLTADVPVNGYIALISMAAGVPLEPGQYFSIGYHLYGIGDVEPVGAGIFRVDFWPNARAAALAGDHVNTSRPVAKVRLKDDNAMQIDLDMNRFGEPVLDLLEDLTP